MNQHVEAALAQESKAARALVDALRARDDADDDLVTDMVEGETGLLEALDAADREIMSCEIIVAGCKEAEARVKARRDRAAARIEHIRAAVEQALVISEVSEKIQRPTATFTLSKRKPDLIVDDESQIPARFFIPQPPKLDKAALRDAVETETIPGCHLSNGSVSLTIRRK